MIKATRGDTIALAFQRKDQNGEVIMDAPTAMYFTMKETYNTMPYVVQKTLADMEMDAEGVWHLVIEPEDTQNLAYGTYAFDIEVTTTEYIATIAKGEICLTEESTWQVNRG